MTTLSLSLLAKTVTAKRKKLKLSQTVLSQKTGINRSLISRIESKNYSPSVDQLLALSDVLGFELQEVFARGTGTNTGSCANAGSYPNAVSCPGVETLNSETMGSEITGSEPTGSAHIPSACNIAVAGTGYVGLSLAVLLSQHNTVTAVDIIPEKVEKINSWQSPIQDEYIEKYMSEHEERGLRLTATINAEEAYKNADFIIIAAPTNYDPKTNFFDCSAVEAVLELVKKATAKSKNKPAIVIKSTIPVG